MIPENLSMGAPEWLIAAVIAIAVVGFSAIVVYFLAPTLHWVRVCAAMLKILGVAALAVCLIEPIASAVRPEPGANVFACLVDNSQSMRIGDSESKQTFADRLERVLPSKSKWSTRLEQDFDVRRYTFDTHLQNVDNYEDIAFDGHASELTNALQTIGRRFSKRPVAGVLLFTDGNATDAAELSQRMATLGFPVYPVIGVSQQTLKDLKIEGVTVTQTNFETAPVTFNITVRHQGMSGEQVVVQLNDDKGELVEERNTQLGDDELAYFRFRFRPEESGITFYQVNAFVKREKRLFEQGQTRLEATLENNSRVALVDRGQGPYRVLYVTGRPNWEFKFLRRALQEDDEVDLVGLLRIAPREPKFSFRDQAISERNPFFEGFDKDEDEVERYDQSVLVRFGIQDEEELRDGFPQAADELFRYHAVIIDDLEAKYFTPDQMLLLRRFVSERGGGLLMLGGQESFGHGGYDRTPVGEMLPVYLARSDTALKGEMRWELTREGTLQSWLRVRATEAAERQRMRDMPPMLTVNEAGRVKPGAAVLATVQVDGTPHVALATQRFGDGQVGALLVGDLWKWGMHRKKDADQDLYQAWRQTARWLVSDVPKRVDMDAKTGGTTDPVNLRITVRNEDFKPQDNATVAVKITPPSGELFEVTAEPSPSDAGTYLVTYWPRETGGYRADAEVTLEDGTSLDGAAAGWASEPAAEEFARLQNDVELLTRLAEETGGRVVQLNELDTFVKKLPSDKIPVTKIEEFHLWHQTWVMLFALACLCGEWGLRRWKGLP